MKHSKEKFRRMFDENEIELKRLDEIEEGYHRNPNLDVEKRIRLLLTVEETRQRRLMFREKLKKELDE